MSDFLTQVSLFETSMVSVERCLAYEVLPIEKGYKGYQAEHKLYAMPKKNAITNILQTGSQNLFPQGKIQMINLTARYPTKSTPVLRNISLEVAPGEKIGIVGRTGAGKTSFIKLFWKCLEQEQGQLLIDGKDIDTLDLKSMRREIMVIS